MTLLIYPISAGFGMLEDGLRKWDLLILPVQV
jgi:hypothetical protein